MLNKLRSQKGFTLIELLIVVAIIGILAAVAIPQFSAYRMRGYNSAAVADLKNVQSAEESINTTFQTYGHTPAGPTGAVLNGAAVNAAIGGTLNGPLSPATNTVLGAFLQGAGPDANGTALVVANIGIGLSNGMRFQAQTFDGNIVPAGVGRTYTVTAKHVSGDRQVAAEAEATAIWACTNSSTAANFANNAIALPAAGLLVTTQPDLTGAPAVACGGSPNTDWVVL